MRTTLHMPAKNATKAATSSTSDHENYPQSVHPPNTHGTRKSTARAKGAVGFRASEHTQQRNHQHG